MSSRSRASACVIVLLLSWAMSDTVVGAPFYLQMAGFTGVEHTRNDGYRFSTVQQINEAGQLRGVSDRYGGGSTWLGVSVWRFHGTGATNIGLVDPEHTRADGHRWSTSYHLNATGQVSGSSTRYIDLTDAGRSGWVYNGLATVKVGLFDAEHTRADGYKYSDVQQLNDLGHARGESNRYIASTDMGRSAWVYNGTATIQLGLFDAAHTREDGYKFSATQQLNAAGHVRGVSNRYIGSADRGRTAWLFDGTETVNIGLLDEEHTRLDGYMHSATLSMNGSGAVSGHSQRYSGSLSRGQSAWVYDGSATVRIGFMDAEHTRTDGNQFSEAQELNAAGHVRGRSDRYSGSTAMGRTAWVYDGSGTVRIGLVDSEHTRADGYRYSVTQQLNEAGHVRGSADRFVGSTAMGWSAWVYNGLETVRIGIVDAEHMRADGYHWSAAGQMNQAGQVRGFTQRYGGSTLMGSSAWIYDGSQTVRIGIVDAEHTRTDGWQRSEALHLSDAGQVHGFSDRFSGSTAMGRSTWVFDGDETIRIGLIDDAHTRSDGFRMSEVQQLNEAGQVRGHSNRYVGSTAMGQTAWIYDPVLSGTVPLLLSIRDDGFASSSATFLSGNGVVLGSYTLYDGMESLGARPFYWHRDDGLHDLASLVDGGLDVYGWSRLASAVGGNGAGQIIGHGLLEDMSSGQMAYRLTPLSNLIPGDANADGQVNIADLGILAANWQGAGFWGKGDFNGDGVVNIADLGILAGNWQAGVGGMSFAEALGMFDALQGVVVPEPGAGWIVAAAGLALLKRRRQ
jgi:hypothetical protein